MLLTSPANPGKVHDYDNNKYAVLHEIVHAYVSVMNGDLDSNKIIYNDKEYEGTIKVDRMWSYYEKMN